MNNCFSATGNANDGELLALIVLVMIILILGIGYFIDFLKRKIKTYVLKRKIQGNNINEEYKNTFVHQNIPLSSY